MHATFGDEIAGVPTETILAITQSQVWGGGAFCDYPSQNKAEGQGSAGSCPSAFCSDNCSNLLPRISWVLVHFLLLSEIAPILYRANMSR